MLNRTPPPPPLQQHPNHHTDKEILEREAINYHARLQPCSSVSRTVAAGGPGVGTKSNASLNLGFGNTGSGLIGAQTAAEMHA